jgi:hypothetical protein
MMASYMTSLVDFGSKKTKGGGVKAPPVVKMSRLSLSVEAGEAHREFMLPSKEVDVAVRCLTGFEFSHNERTLSLFLYETEHVLVKRWVESLVASAATVKDMESVPAGMKLFNFRILAMPVDPAVSPGTSLMGRFETVGELLEAVQEIYDEDSGDVRHSITYTVVIHGVEVEGVDYIAPKRNSIDSPVEC